MTTVNNNKLTFMDGTKILLKKIPKYPLFEGEFIENMDVTLCKMIIDTPDIAPVENVDGFKTAVYNNLKSNGDLVVIHNQRHGLGRFYADKNRSLIPHPRSIKHTLFTYGDWVDLDMVKGHPSIAVEVFGGILDLPHIKKVVNGFDDVVKKLSLFYEVEGTPLSNDNIKWLFNMMIYGGTPDGWKKKLEKGGDGYEGKKILNFTAHDPFVLQFEKECQSISDIVYKNNPAIVKKVKKESDTLRDKKNSTISYFYQIIENHIVYSVYELLVGMRIITPKKCGLEMDGLNIPPNGSIYDKDDTIKTINNFVFNDTGLNIKFKFKSYGESVMQGLIDERKNMVVAEPVMNDVIMAVVEDNENEEDIVGVMDGDDSSASKIILNAYPHWKCCNDILYVFDDETGMWSDKVEIHNRIISRFSQYLDILKINNDGEVKRTGRNYAKNNQKRKDIYPFIRENCVDNDWVRRTETSSLGKILFLNGHYDFKRGRFLTGRPIGATDKETINTVFENGFNPEIVFFYRVDHEHTDFTDDDMEYMDSIQERLFTLPLGKDVGDYLTLNLARAFSGDITIKRILFGLGMSNSGKGILTKACQLSMGQYCGVFTGENLAFNNVNNDEAQKMRWAMLLRNKRLIISNELSTTKMLDGNLIKKLASGGDTIQGRLHGQHETDFKPQYLSILLANDMPPIKPFDTAIQNRVRVYSYTKAFVDEPRNEYELKKDPNLDNEMKSRLFQRCFIGLLIRKYSEFKDSGCVENEPNEVVMARNDWIGTTEENDIINKFQQFYEITNCESDYTPSKEIENCIRTMGDMSYKKFVMELKKNCILKSLKNVRNDGKTVNKKSIQVWFGIKHIEDNSNYSDDITAEL
jgi:hypothetical protein